MFSAARHTRQLARKLWRPARLQISLVETDQLEKSGARHMRFVAPTESSGRVVPAIGGGAAGSASAVLCAVQL
jgi:hypothetical protein